MVTTLVTDSSASLTQSSNDGSATLAISESRPPNHPSYFNECHNTNNCKNSDHESDHQGDHEGDHGDNNDDRLVEDILCRLDAEPHHIVGVQPPSPFACFLSKWRASRCITVEHLTEARDWGAQQGPLWSYAEDCTLADIFTSVAPDLQPYHVSCRLPGREWVEAYRRFHRFFDSRPRRSRYPFAFTRRKPSCVVFVTSGLSAALNSDHIANPVPQKPTRCATLFTLRSRILKKKSNVW